MTAATFLVTGATGWIGSHLTRLLVNGGHHVLALVRPGARRDPLADIAGHVEWVEADLADGAMLAEGLRGVRPDACLHAAWHTVPGRYLEARENLDCVQGSVNLIRLLADQGCGRFVGLGTCMEYDLASAAAPLAEAAPLRPRTLYAACKHAVHVIAAQALPRVAWARVFYLYGPGEAEERLVPYVVSRLRAGAECDLSAGTQVRDYLHVADAAAALVAVAMSETCGAVNVASGQPVTVSEVARTAAEILGIAGRILLGARATSPGDPAYVVADTRRLREEVGWRPRFDLRSGLRDVVHSDRSRPR